MFFESGVRHAKLHSLTLYLQTQPYCVSQGSAKEIVERFFLVLEMWSLGFGRVRTQISHDNEHEGNFSVLAEIDNFLNCFACK